MFGLPRMSEGLVNHTLGIFGEKNAWSGLSIRELEALVMEWYIKYGTREACCEDKDYTFDLGQTLYDNACIRMASSSPAMFTLTPKALALIKGNTNET